MIAIFNQLKEFWKSFAYFLVGLVLLVGFLIYTVFSLPIFIYRWSICEVFGPLCGLTAVSLSSVIMATEQNEERHRIKPRHVIVGNAIFEGSIPFEQLKDAVGRRWINAVDSDGKRLKHPEFQQYIESWMGYLFFKPDRSFNLRNHLVHRKCDDNCTERECEQFDCSIVEDLLNKPLPKGISPWEIQMISNYRNSEILSNGKEMTVLHFRFHHSIADGFAMFYVIYEELLGFPFSKCMIAQLSPPRSVTSWLGETKDFASFPIRAIHELGYAASLMLFPVMTPWYIPEGKRIGRLLYVRSGMLPISKLKFVKNKFGVSFSATLLSSVAAGIASSLKSKGFPNHIKDLPFGSSLPLKGHPCKLRNHWSAVFYEIPIDQTLTPIERLKQSEKHFQKAKQSTYPYLFPFALKMAGLQLPFLSKLMLCNRALSTAMSNFPGPGEPVSGFGRNGIVMDVGAGLGYGVGGLGFAFISYGGYIRLSIVAEKAAMERHELDELLKSICDEIDTLSEMAERENPVSIRATA